MKWILIVGCSLVALGVTIESLLAALGKTFGQTTGPRRIQ
jgi:hypothetical protein